MGRNIQDSGFEDYRRERNKHRLNSAPRRDLGSNARVLQELEQVEASEARNQQLTREVHDFFSDATRTAAEIVQKVSQDQEHQIEDRLSAEMAEFLAVTIRRAQEFVNLIQISANSELAETELIANMQNLVGSTLDDFRAEGTAKLADKHLGLDPFVKELEVVGMEGIKSDSDSDAAVGDGTFALADIEPMVDTVPELAPGTKSESSIEEHLVATEESAADISGDEGWFLRMKDDPEKLKTTLKVMVSTGAMSKDEALTIYRKTMS